MVSIPDEIKIFIPKIYDYKISNKNDDSDFSYITMEYINKQSFDQIYLNQILNKNEIDLFFNHIKAFLNKTKSFAYEISKEERDKLLYNIYYLKTVDRVNEIKNDKNFKFYYDNQITINGKKITK